MGIALLLVFLGMLVGFSYLGLRSGVPAIQASRSRLGAALALSVMAVVLAVIEVVLPFAIVSSTRVSAGGFTVIITLSVVIIASLAGTFFAVKFRRTEFTIYGLCSAAFSFAAGLFPIIWFLLADRVSACFEVGWIY